MNGVKEVSLVPVESPQAPDVVAQIVALAGNEQMDVAKLEKLIEMQERVMKSQAESAFNAAFSVMQGEIPTVVERGVGHNNASYAPLEDIIEAIRPILTKHGFALSHKTEWPEKGMVRIVGILAHKLGHARHSEFNSGADTTGSKNAVQALGSAITYGRRYTTNDLLGIVTRKQDDDGMASSRASVVDPHGFVEWLTDFEVVARDGIKALSAVWKESKIEYRDHANKHYGGRVAAAKKLAEAVR